MRSGRTAWAVLAGALMSGAAASAQAGTHTVGAVPQLDLKRLAGGWYEVERLPDKPEKHCVGDAMQIYSLGDKPGRFQMVESCILKDGEASIHNANGRVDKAGGGHLKLGFLFPFTSKLLVIAVDPAYDWAMIGTPNHKSLWLLSHNGRLAPEVLARLTSLAQAEGFRTSKLLKVTQQHLPPPERLP